MVIPSALISSSDLSKSNKSKLTNTINNKKLYTQALKINIEDVIHIKDIFPTLSPKKIVDINNIINKSNMVKLKINMTTKRPSRKQVIILMTKSNMEVILNQANFLIININRHHKKANSNTIVDFIHLKNDGVVITTSQATFA